MAIVVWHDANKLGRCLLCAGVVMVKIGREEPVASMDTSGKIIWARHNEVQTVNVKSLGADYEVGALLALACTATLPLPFAAHLPGGSSWLHSHAA